MTTSDYRKREAARQRRLNQKFIDQLRARYWGLPPMSSAERARLDWRGDLTAEVINVVRAMLGKTRFLVRGGGEKRCR